MSRALRASGSLLVFACLLSAGDNWQKKERSQWSQTDTERILHDSPWAKRADGFIGTTDEDPHTYPTKGPSARDIGLGGRSNNDEWFPVGKIPATHMPTLPVLVRWDSAMPVREAMVQSHAPGAADTDASLASPEKYYIIGLYGLALPRKPDADPNEETRVRQAIVNESRLMVRGKHPIVPEDARVDKSTGTIRIYFPKDNPITADDKEVTFGTVFGGVRVIQKFRLKEMLYKGELTL